MSDLDVSALEELYRMAWRETPSRVADPERRQYWQRWEGPGEYDWIELPSHMPPQQVLLTIRDLAKRRDL